MEHTPLERPFLRERIGHAAGWVGAPVFGLVSALRRARTFHPDGVVLRAAVEPLCESTPRWRNLADRLRGSALLRFSSALWKHGRESVDTLGCAVRFCQNDRGVTEAAPGDQDLLFSTARSPWTLLVAALGTHVHDFLANEYFASAPFDVPGIGRTKWKLVPEQESMPGPTRRARLLATVGSGKASLRLEVRHTWTPIYVPVARLRVREAVSIDQEALRFNPFHAGRGIEPRGFVHAIRRGAYAGSQALRPSRAGARMP